MSATGNELKDTLLGEPHGTAANRLRKNILFDLLKRHGENVCFRCGEEIDDVGKLSIEHKEPWQQADNPVLAFFDLNNIAFSHLKCNIGATRNQSKLCSRGHPLHEAKTQRRCEICERENRRRFRLGHPEQDTKKYRRDAGWDKK